MLAHVPVPGVDQAALDTRHHGQNAVPAAAEPLLRRRPGDFSIIALGVNPYINASIIMQLMTGVVPRLQQLQREGEYGRNKINQYTRYLTVPHGASCSRTATWPCFSSQQNGVVIPAST